MSHTTTTVTKNTSVPQPIISKNTTQCNTNYDQPICIAKGDSAASKHYWMSQFQHVLDDIHREDGPPVTLPNKTSINDDIVGYLPLT